MRHEAHVRLVDAHAEGHRRHHRQAVLAQEAALIRRARLGWESRVVDQRRAAVALQPVRGLLHPAAGRAVDDAAVGAVVRVQKRQQLLAQALALADVVTDVRAIETRREHRRSGEPKALHDVALRRPVGGGGQRQPRHAGKALAEHTKAEIFRPEVVPPLRHAVRLVDRDQRHRHARQQFQRALADQALRRHVNHLEPPGEQIALDRRRLAGRQARVQRRRGHAELAQRRHLIVHQRDQRRHHHAHAIAHQRRHLIAQRLATARGHDHQRVAAADHVIDDGRLPAAKGVVAEDAGEDVERGVEAGECHGASSTSVTSLQRVRPADDRARGRRGHRATPNRAHSHCARNTWPRCQAAGHAGCAATA